MGTLRTVYRLADSPGAGIVDLGTLQADMALDVSAPYLVDISGGSGAPLWFEEDWDYVDQAAMDATPGVGQSGSVSSGHSYPITLGVAGPWGTTKALQVTFNPANPWDQPQAGAIKEFPYPVSEVWTETWIRFDSNWTTNPPWEQPPGTPQGNQDHKTFFIYETNHVQRWEYKIGVYAATAIGSAGNHDASYAEWYNPPVAMPNGQYDYNLWQAHKAANPGGNFDPTVYAWDNQWHNVRTHARIGAGDGVFKVWWDGVLWLHHRDVDSQSAGRQFWKYCLGANRNSGPTESMGFQWGPVRSYLTDPGWV